jgi:glucokinase
MASVIGVDLGGTKSALARFDRDSFTCLGQEFVPTDASRGFDAVLEDMVKLIEKHRTPDTTHIGVAVPGLVRTTDGFLLNAPNIPGAKNIALRTILRDRLGMPIAIGNDARCFALAEALHGAGRGKRVVIGITMGTGVGGGIVIDGKIFTGHQGFAGEVGHMLLVPGQPPYVTDDKRGEVEQFFSGTAFGNRCKQATHPEQYLEGEVCSFLQPQVFRELAWFCVSLSHLLDPSIIVFGGSAGRALTPHLGKIEKEMMQWILPGTPLPEIAIARLQDPGSLGAALLAIEQEESRA